MLRDPQRRAAAQAVRVALRAGHIERPDRCQHCGERAKLVACPRDLLRPLASIAWMCHHCRWALGRGPVAPPARRPSPSPSPRPLAGCMGVAPGGAPCRYVGRYRRGGRGFFCGHHFGARAR